jgi:WD40 repeat protein
VKRTVAIVAAGTALALTLSGCGETGSPRVHGSPSPHVQGTLLLLRFHGFPGSPYDRFFLWRSGSGATPFRRRVSTYAVAQWSPDGRSIAYGTSQDNPYALGGRDINSIHVMRSDGTNVRMLAGRTGDTALSWSPDGREIAYKRGGKLAIVDLRTGQRRTLTRAAVTKQSGAVFAWGKPGIAYKGHDGEIKLANPGTGRSRLIAHGSGDSLSLVWSRSGVLAADEGHWALHVYSSRFVFFSASGRVLGELSDRHGDPQCSPVWSPNGKQILVTAPNGVVWVVTVSAKRWQRLPVHADGGCAVGWR